MRARQHGFTLIEIMVVVVILAVLGALVVPAAMAELRACALHHSGAGRYSSYFDGLGSVPAGQIPWH